MTIETKKKSSEDFVRNFGLEYFQNSLVNSAKHKQDRTKYFPEDFPKYFGVEHLQQTIVDPDVLHLLDNHDITLDPQYAKIDVQKRIDLHGYFFERGGFPDDRRVYVAYSSPEMGFGVFANVYIPAWTIVAEYTGVITRNFRNTDYVWVYYSTPKDSEGNEVTLKVDGRTKGNVARFVNHSENPNCDVIHVPYKNRWRTIYVSNRSLLPDEELTVYYGTKYWSTRTKVDK
jgi:hypothetical protein